MEAQGKMEGELEKKNRDIEFVKNQLKLKETEHDESKKALGNL